MVEGGITIKGIRNVIDSCKRKVPITDENGMIELILEDASKANVLQSLGRAGREKYIGKGYVMITKTKFDSLRDYPHSEVKFSPLYQQIIRITRAGLSISDIFPDDPLRKKANDGMRKLIEEGYLKFEKHGVNLTRKGAILTQVHLSLPSINFITCSMNLLDGDILYYAVVIACWMELNESIFYRIKRKHKEKFEDFEKRSEEHNAKTKTYSKKKEDDLMTALKIWVSNPKYSDAGLHPKTMSEWKRSVKFVISSLRTLKICIDDKTTIKDPDYIHRRLALPLYFIYHKERVTFDVFIRVSKYNILCFEKETDENNYQNNFPNLYIPLGVKRFKLEKRQLIGAIIKVRPPVLSNTFKNKLYDISGLNINIWESCIFKKLKINDLYNILTAYIMMFNE